MEAQFVIFSTEDFRGKLFTACMIGTLLNPVLIAKIKTRAITVFAHQTLTMV